MNINNFNEYATVTRTILFKHEREPLSSMKAMSQAALGTATQAEVMRNIQKPMKETNDAIKASWIV